MKLDKALDIGHNPPSKFEVNNSDSKYQSVVEALATLAAYCDVMLAERKIIERKL